MDGVTGSQVDWTHLDGTRVWLRLLSSGDIVVVIDGGYGTKSQVPAQEMAADWARDLGMPLEPL